MAAISASYRRNMRGRDVARYLGAIAFYAVTISVSGAAVILASNHAARTLAPALSSAFFPDRIPRFAPADLADHGASGPAIIAHLEEKQQQER